MRTMNHRRILAVAMLLLCASGSHAHTMPVRGRVEVIGTQAGLRPAKIPATVVWLTPMAGEATTALPPSTNLRLVQKNKSFEPHILVVPAGSVVEFPNRDPFFHNVFSLFEGKRFDLGLYESGTTRFVQFDKPGISFIFCNIHEQMSAVVIALATPYYAIADARGDLSIPNVPPGRYELQVFHSAVAPDALRALSREITVAPGDTSLGTFTLTETNVAQAHKNKYGREYDRPDPDSPAYARP